MPHLLIEYTANLKDIDNDKMLRTANAALAASGHFAEDDIKSRMVRHDHFRIGTHPENRAFLFAKLSLLNGRTAEVKKQLSSLLLKSLHESYASPTNLHIQYCAEIIDMDRDSYAKEK